MATTTPKNWPPDVHFLTRSIYPLNIPTPVLAELRGSRVKAPPQPVPPCHLVRIQVILDPSHPAHEQRGLFAAKKIPSNSLILFYLGEIHIDTRDSSDYDLSLYRSSDISVGIDAAASGNEARFINDYRGIMARPNCIFKDIKTVEGELRMSVWSVRHINKHEELCVSYGKAWWNNRRGEDG